MPRDKVLLCIGSSVAAGICLAAYVIVYTPKLEKHAFNGIGCKAQHRFTEIRCGTEKLKVGEITLKGVGPDEPPSGSTFNCFRSENEQPECHYVDAVPT